MPKVLMQFAVMGVLQIMQELEQCNECERSCSALCKQRNKYCNIMFFWTRKGSLIATTVVLLVVVLVVTIFEKCLRLC